jgi:hypothetical protein
MSANSASGFSSDHGGMPPAVMTMSSLSVLRRFKTWMAAISRPMGAIRAVMAGMASVVMSRNRRASWPWEVISSSWRSATAIHTTPVSDTRMRISAPAVCRKMYRLRMRIEVPRHAAPGVPPRGPVTRQGGKSFKDLPRSIARWRKGGPMCRGGAISRAMMAPMAQPNNGCWPLLTLVGKWLSHNVAKMPQ